MRFSLFTSARDNQPEPREGTWEEFNRGLLENKPTHPDPTGARSDAEWDESKKHLLAFSPGSFRSGTTRKNENVESVSMLALDFDDIPNASVPALLARFDGLAYLIHTTPGAARCAPGFTRLRIILPFAAPVRGKDWPKVWAALVRHFGLSDVAGFDAACNDAARLYFVPCEGCTGFVAEGEFLDPRTLPTAALPARAVVSSGPLTREALRKIGDKFERSRDADKKAAGGTLKRIADGVMSAEHPHRDEAMKLATWHLAQAMPGIDPDEFLVLAQESMNAAGARDDDPDEARVRGLLEGALEKVTKATDAASLCTDSANAERLIEYCDNRIRYVVGWRKWIAWDGSRWDLDGGSLAASRLAKEAARDLGTSNPALAKFARDSESRAKRDAAVVLAATETAAQITHDALDADEWVLNTPRGIVDLRTGLLRPPDPNALCTKQTGVAFDPTAQAPRWERFLLEIMNGDLEMVSFLRRAVGYSATGSPREHVLFFLIGGGRNGKGVFIETVLAALGSYAGPVNPSLLLAAEGERHLTEIASLHKLRFAAFSEINEGKIWDEAKLKRLTGGDTLVARRMREDEWTFQPTHKPWVAANVAPEVRGSNDAIWSRMVRIAFPVSFLGREDRGLVAALRSELPGVLAWIVRGALEWQAQGLVIPASVRRETDKYREQQDLVSQFVRESAFAGPHPRSGVRARYETWCRATGSYALPNRLFNEAMRQRGIEETQPRRWPGGSTTEGGWQFSSGGEC